MLTAPIANMGVACRGFVRVRLFNFLSADRTQFTNAHTCYSCDTLCAILEDRQTNG